MEKEITEIKNRMDELQQELSDPAILSDAAKVRERSIEFAKLEKKFGQLSHIQDLERKLNEAKEMQSGGDSELAHLAEEEINLIEKELKQLQGKIGGVKDLPDDIIMEIRAGAGGDEASLFGQQLFLMYTRFAESRGWQVSVITESRTDLGGVKEIVFEIDGEGVYRALRWESGVHRVQRIPETEKSGRIHTSTASVAVLPKAREVDVEIRPQDIKIEFFRSSGPGGQNVNKVETAVRIYHLSTGLIVTSQNQRSQQQNRERAMGVLRARIYDAKLQQEQQKMAAERKAQIGTGDRSEKIRTYNFPQDRITDHRIKESWHNIPSVLAGDLDQIINSLNQAMQNPVSEQK